MSDTVKPCILSIFMQNIDKKTLELQKRVVQKFNKKDITHIQVLTDGEHGLTMNKLLELMEKNQFDAVMFLDIDCVPLNDNAFDYMFTKAYEGVLIGDAQRSNHIQNNQHVFCAPHNFTFTLDTFKKCGSPSLSPNQRGDVGEELTFKARESNIPVELLMPIRFDAPPIRMAWEPKDLPPYWDLADGMPKYGIGTTYGANGEEMFWHMFQSFHPGQQERFWNKCEELLNG